MDTYPGPGVRRRLALNPPELFPFELVRILDHELALLASRLRLLEHDLERAFYRACKQRHHTLPTTLVGAEHLFGRSSTRFDPDKGSFRFPLWLSATREGVPLRYHLDIRDVRGTVDIVFARFQPDPVTWWKDRPLPPVESEISGKEIDLLIGAVLDFIFGCGTTIMPHVAPFYRAIRSELTLYGCRSGEAFQREFESCEAYENAEQAISRDLADTMNEQVRADIDALLGDLARAELRCP